jgi:hypothetical protein
VNDAPISKELIDILACPSCEDRPRVEPKEDGLHCPKCGRIYPIENGIPIMLVEKASK